MKHNILNIPIFHEPERAVNEYHTSSTQSLWSATWLHYLWWLSHNSELKQFFTQYCAQHGLVNAVNSKSVLLSMCSFSLTTLILILKITVDKASSSVWNQIFNHHFNAVWYYLNWKIQFNMQVMFLNCSFNDIVQKLIRLMTLNNLNALTKLFNKLLKKMTNSKWVVQLSYISKDLIKKLKKKYQFVWLASSNDSLLKKKKEVNVVLHHEKINCQNQILKKA